MTMKRVVVLLPLLFFSLRAVSGETFQAEDATIVEGCKILNRHEGFEGTGYADYNGGGSYVLWNINIPVAGNHQFTVRYASKSARPLVLIVGGTNQGAVASLATGEWTKWATETKTVFLEKGSHALKLLAATSDGPNVDWISLQAMGPTPMPLFTPVGISHTPVFYDPKDAFAHNIQFLDRHNGFDGSGYADFDDYGSYLLWNIRVPMTGDYDITVRYASKSARPLDLILDVTKQGAIASLATGGWTNWSTDTETFLLKQGSHTLKLLAADSSGPNVNWLSIQSLGTFHPTDSPISLPTSNPSPTPKPTTASPILPLTSKPSPMPTLISTTATSNSPKPSPMPIPRPATATPTLLLTPKPSPTPTPEPTTASPTSLPTREPSSMPTPEPTIAPVSASPTNIGTVVYEPQDAIAYNVEILQMHSGYQSSSGYGDYEDYGSYLFWTVEASVAADHEIIARYAAQDSRPADLLVDGVKRGTFSFSSTGEWTSWSQETMMVVLGKGTHSLKLLASESKGPNLDWLSISPVSSGPHPQPTTSPTLNPSASSFPSTSPTQPQPTSSPSASPTIDFSFPEEVVLDSNSYLSRGDFVSSPSGDYKVGLTDGGDLVLQDKDSKTIWSAGVNGGYRCYMQSDGNLIIRDVNKKRKWTARTYNNPGARLIVDDGGYIAVMHGTTAKWLDGIPRGEYSGPSSKDLMFPVRGVFYYPWYPETWTVNGKFAHFEPNLGFYSSSDPRVAKSHIDAFEYAHVDLSIASWWGPETNLDRARMTMLMNETIALNSQVKWTIYHEDERASDPSPEALREDLDYLKKWFAWHPAWAHMDGRPVIFVYNEGGCEVSKRWMEAADGEWYVVLKLFGGYKACPIQPDHWHQYGVGGGYIAYKNYSATVAPGFWRADKGTPSLPRLSESVWCQNVQKMVASGEPLQLVVSFNEAGEGTMIEASPSWSSNTPYGLYLDCLHNYV